MLSYSPIFAKMWLKPVLDWRTIGIQYPPQSHRFSNQVACLASAAHASRLWYCPAKAIYLTMMYFTVILQWFYGTSWWFYGTWWWFYSCFMVLYDDFTVNLWWFDGLDQQKIKEHAGLYGDILMPSDPESGFCHIFGCFQMTVVWSSLMGIAIDTVSYQQYDLDVCGNGEFTPNLRQFWWGKWWLINCNYVFYGIPYVQTNANYQTSEYPAVKSVNSERCLRGGLFNGLQQTDKSDIHRFPQKRRLWGKSHGSKSFHCQVQHTWRRLGPRGTWFYVAIWSRMGPPSYKLVYKPN